MPIAAACGFPIRPVLKHGPRSLTCVQVIECGNSLGVRKLIDGILIIVWCTVDRPGSFVKGSSVSIPVGTRKMVNYA